MSSFYQSVKETGTINLNYFATMAVLNSFFMDLIVGIISFGVLLGWYINHNRTYWQRRGVHTIPGHWLYGNAKDILTFKRSPAIEIGELHQQASEKDDVLGIYILHKPFLLLRNPEIIKQILVKDFNYFQNRYFTARSFHDKIGSSNLFTIKNPEWRYLRTKISPVFTGGKMKKIFHMITETAESMSKYLEVQFPTNSKTQTIPIRDVSLKYMTDVISSIAFGIKLNSFDPEKVQFFNKVQEGLNTTFYRAALFFTMFFFPKISPYIGGQMLGTSTNYFRNIFWDSLNARETNKSKRGDLIDTLIELKNEEQDNKFKFEGDALVSQSAIFFVAGRESSVSTICFTLYELAKYPEIQKRTREEINEKLNEHGLTYDSVQSMKYLHQVLSETLRLYPPAPLIDRVSIDNYKVPETDIVIEKGTPVYVALCGLQRDPKYFPDPLCFNPDRFSEENKRNILPGTYMPFGDGPRACIGMRLGMLQSAIGVITVLKDYEVSLNSTLTDVIDHRNVFLTPVEGFSLNLTKL